MAQRVNNSAAIIKVVVVAHRAVVVGRLAGVTQTLDLFLMDRDTADLRHNKAGVVDFR